MLEALFLYAGGLSVLGIVGGLKVLDEGAAQLEAVVANHGDMVRAETVARVSAEAEAEISALSQAFVEKARDSAETHRAELLEVEELAQRQLDELQGRYDAELRQVAAATVAHLQARGWRPPE